MDESGRFKLSEFGTMPVEEAENLMVEAACMPHEWQQAFASRIAPYLPPDTEEWDLDIGCGDMRIWAALAETAWSYEQSWRRRAKRRTEQQEMCAKLKQYCLVALRLSRLNEELGEEGARLRQYENIRELFAGKASEEEEERGGDWEIAVRVV